MAKENNPCKMKSAIDQKKPVDGIFLANTSTYNTLTGNICSDTQATAIQRYGIIENSSDDDHNTIVANVCIGNITGQIATNGANTILGFNVVDNTGNIYIKGRIVNEALSL